jgi:menaquinone-dependent protoporphyrinogen oxidase
MFEKVLVAYASRHGSTAEIAEKIGSRLNAADFMVDVLPVEQVKDLAGYHAAVLGAAVYVGAWVKPFAKFLSTNRESLARMPVWLFSSGPLGKGDPVELLDGWRFPETHRPLVEYIAPKEITVFHGALFTEKLNFIENKMIQMVKSDLGDFRDWDEITVWTDKVAKQLQG